MTTFHRSIFATAIALGFIVFALFRAHSGSAETTSSVAAVAQVSHHAPAPVTPVDIEALFGLDEASTSAPVCQGKWWGCSRPDHRCCPGLWCKPCPFALNWANCCQ
jgi:hypothetical protein